jgi:thiol-disulfide isomerase/thioredoxin
MAVQHAVLWGLNLVPELRNLAEQITRRFPAKYAKGIVAARHPGLEVRCSGVSHLPAPPLHALDLVGIYFSAHWCPPCRKFTPLLAEVYKEIAAAGKKIGVVFVSSDRDEESFREYFRKMPWVMILGSAACISAADESCRLHCTMHRGICKKV